MIRFFVVVPSLSVRGLFDDYCYCCVCESKYGVKGIDEWGGLNAFNGVLPTLVYQDTKSRLSLCVSFCLSLCISLFYLSLSLSLSLVDY